MSEVVTYNAEGLDSFQVLVENETVWLNRQQMAALFERDIKTIGKHIANALSEELSGFSVVAKFATTAADGKVYQVEHYSLDVILSVGYRVKSRRGVQFRQWATTVLREHLLRGYTVKQPVSVEQLNGVKDEIQALANEINELLQHVDKTDVFVFEEFGRVYDIIHQLTEQKRQMENTPKKPFGYARYA
jgi:hypothetical protein